MRLEAPHPPYWRWEQIQKALEEGLPPADPFLRDVYDVMRETREDPVIKEALYLYHVPVLRDTVMAFFLSGATNQQVASGTGVTGDVLQVFEALFIDRKAFRNKIEWRLYAQYYAGQLSTQEVKKQIEAGVIYGPSVLLDYWTMGNEIPEVPEKEITARIAMMAYTKALVGRNSPINSAAAKEAFRWGTLAVKSVMDIRAAKGDENTDMDALLAIDERKDVLTPKELGLAPTDIVH